MSKSVLINSISSELIKRLQIKSGKTKRQIIQLKYIKKWVMEDTNENLAIDCHGGFIVTFIK